MDHRCRHRGSERQHPENLQAERIPRVWLKLVRRPFRHGQLPLRHPIAGQCHDMSPGRFPLLDWVSQDCRGLQGTRRGRMREIGVTQDVGHFLGGNACIDQGLQCQTPRRLAGGFGGVHVQLVYQRWQ